MHTLIINATLLTKQAALTKLVIDVVLAVQMCQSYSLHMVF